MKRYQNLNAEDFIEQFQVDNDAILLDVRSEKEYDEGHLTNSINIPVTDQEKLLSLDKAKKYYLHCRVGGRSAIAAHLLVQEGFEYVYNLNDDLTNAFDYIRSLQIEE